MTARHEADTMDKINTLKPSDNKSLGTPPVAIAHTADKCKLMQHT